jgi:hypothetical protein
MSEKVQIKPFVGDLITLEMETVAPFERQIEDEAFKRFPLACRFVIDARRILNDQVTALRGHLDDIGGQPSTGFKAAVSDVVGAAVSMIQPSRKTQVSQYLRDDHAALSTLCLSYEMLHASALATHDYSTASLALRHLEDLASVSMECSRVIPTVVVTELVEQDNSLDDSVADEAERNIHRAWKVGAKLEHQRECHKQFAASV